MDAVADCRQVERRQGVKEAGGQAAEAAIAEAHVVLLLAEHVQVEAEPLQSLLHLLHDAGAIHAVDEEPTHQKLERKVINPPDILVVVGGLRLDHPFDDEALHGLGRGDPPVAGGGRDPVAGKAEFQAVEDVGFDIGFCGFGGIHGLFWNCGVGLQQEVGHRDLRPRALCAR